MSTAKLLGDEHVKSKSTQKISNADSKEAIDDADNDSIDNVKQALLHEECVDKTSNIILSSLSWVNAGLFQAALYNTTIVYGSDDDIKNAYLDLSFMLIFSILVAIIPRIWENTEKTKKELLYDDNIENQVISKYDTESFWTKLEYLLVASTALALSMICRDASRITFESFIGSRNIESAAYILYAVCWTIIGIYVTIKVTKYIQILDQKVIQQIDSLDMNDHTESDTATADQHYDAEISIHPLKELEIKDILIKYATWKRFYKLILLTTSLVMAWSWRTAIDSFVLGMYGGDKLTPTHGWIYCFIVTLFISFFNAIIEHYYCLYPRNIQSQNLYQTSKTREKIGKLLQDNCNFVVGFSWRDAIKITIFKNQTDNIGLNIFLFWFIAIFLIISSIVSTHYFEKYKFSKKIKEIGATEWIIKQTKQLNIGNNDDNNIGYGRHEIPKICDTYYGKILELMIISWSIAGSLFVSDAVLYSILGMYSNISDYNIDDLNNQTKTSEGLWLQWMFIIFSLVVTALIMTYLLSAIQVLRKQRKVIANTIVYIHQNYVEKTNIDIYNLNMNDQELEYDDVDSMNYEKDNVIIVDNNKK